MKCYNYERSFYENYDEKKKKKTLRDSNSKLGARRLEMVRRSKPLFVPKLPPTPGLVLMTFGL